MNLNKKGILNFQIKDIENGKVGEILAFIKFTPVRVECMYYERYYKMVGYSEIFPEVKEGNEVPQYDLTIRPDEEGNLFSVTIKD